MSAPTRFVRVTGTNLLCFALDVDGRLWLRMEPFERDWRELPTLPRRAKEHIAAIDVVDLYVHLHTDIIGSTGALRVLDTTGNLWELRIGLWDGPPVWDAVFS